MAEPCDCTGCRWAAEIRARLDGLVSDSTLFDEARARDRALRAVLDLCDHGGTLPVAGWVSGPVLLAAIGDAMGVRRD